MIKIFHMWITTICDIIKNMKNNTPVGVVQCWKFRLDLCKPDIDFLTKLIIILWNGKSIELVKLLWLIKSFLYACV